MPTPTDFTDFQFAKDDATNRQFSSDKADTPEAMAAETRDSQNAFAELQNFLMNNLETPGSRVCHYGDRPWTPPHGAEGE